MASTSALERTELRLLQPVYNALDTRNVPAALRACTQVLPRLRSKQVKHVAMSIKAHLLHLSRKRTESAALVDEILKEQIDSIDALGYLRVTLTALDRVKEITPLYESAFERSPKDGALGLQLCMTYVRSHSWAGLQKVAFKLHNLLPNDSRPYSWSIFALYAQSLKVASPADAKQPLTLARALLKSPSANSSKSPSHIWLKTSVLLALASAVETEAEEEVLQQAWDFLESEEVKRMGGGNLEVDLVRWDVVRRLGKVVPGLWKSEWSALQTRIQGIENVPAEDNYQLYLNIIALVVLLSPSDSEPRDQTQSFFETMTERNEGRERGPWLALLQLEADLPQEGGSTVAPLQAYFERFGGKACCFEDLQSFLPTDDTDVQALRQYLVSSLEREMTSLDDVRLKVNSLKVLQHLSTGAIGSTGAQSEWIVDQCKQLYVRGLPFGKNLNPDELQPVDDLIIIAVNCLIKDWSNTGDIKQLLSAVILLENAQKSSTMNHYLRLLLIRVYRLLGSPSLAKPNYQALKVDHVLHDTLSHFMATRASTFAVGDALDDEPDSLFSSLSKGTTWFKQTLASDVEQLVLALSNEVYPQVADLSSYLSQLSTSLQRQVLQIEHTKQLLVAPNGEAMDPNYIKHWNVHVAALPKGPLADNRDFKLVPSYQPRGCAGVEELLAVGPKVEASWVAEMRSTYSAIFGQAEVLRNGQTITANGSSNGNAPESLVSEGGKLELTVDEADMSALAKSFLLWSEEARDASSKKPLPIEPVKAFFATQSDRLNVALQDAEGLPWKILHSAAVALDGFGLLMLLAKALPSSRIRTLTDPVISVMKSIASRLKQQAEKVGSAKTLKEVRKTLPSLASAGVKDDFVVEVVAKIGASRREGMNGLSRAILEAVAFSTAV